MSRICDFCDEPAVFYVEVDVDLCIAHAEEFAGVVPDGRFSDGRIRWRKKGAAE